MANKSAHKQKNEKTNKLKIRSKKIATAQIIVLIYVSTCRWLACCFVNGVLWWAFKNQSTKISFTYFDIRWVYLMDLYNLSSNPFQWIRTNLSFGTLEFKEHGFILYPKDSGVVNLLLLFTKLFILIQIQLECTVWFVIHKKRHWAHICRRHI